MSFLVKLSSALAVEVVLVAVEVAAAAVVCASVCMRWSGRGAMVDKWRSEDNPVESLLSTLLLIFKFILFVFYVHWCLPACISV